MRESWRSAEAKERDQSRGSASSLPTYCMLAHILIAFVFVAESASVSFRFSTKTCIPSFGVML
eukprot:m.573845 g.573845  ORF g.573845 m.573845 type:complete len:63 (+) comp57882_c0_seq39:295-483(+)